MTPIYTISEMTPVYTVSEMTYVDVTDFQTVIGQEPEQWDALVDNTDNLFHGFSHVDQMIATIINNHVGRADRVCIKGLDNYQRHKFYKGLSLDIDFDKQRLTTGETDIRIHLTSGQQINHLWTIPSYSDFNRKYNIPEILDDPSAPENIRTFYHRINIPTDAISTTSRVLLQVTLDEYIRFQKLSRWYFIMVNSMVRNPESRRRLPSLYWISPNGFTQRGGHQPQRIAVQTPAPPVQTVTNVEERNRTRTSNRNIRLELSDMVFDIKDKISDQEFKIIMDKMSEFLC
jgi:hypothetical protein